MKIYNFVKDSKRMAQNEQEAIEKREIEVKPKRQISKVKKKNTPKESLR